MNTVDSFKRQKLYLTISAASFLVSLLVLVFNGFLLMTLISMNGVIWAGATFQHVNNSQPEPEKTSQQKFLFWGALLALTGNFLLMFWFPITVFYMS